MHRKIVILFLSTIYFLPVKLKMVNFLDIDNLTDCGHPVPNSLANLSVISLAKGKMVVSGTIEIKKSANQLPSVCTIYKCNSKALKDCESFLRISLKDFCKIFTEKRQFWSVFYDAVTPRMSCPLPVNTVYHFSNASIDAHLLLKTVGETGFGYFSGLYEYYWRFKTQIYSPSKEELACAAGSGQLKRMRKRD